MRVNYVSDLHKERNDPEGKGEFKFTEVPVDLKLVIGDDDELRRPELLVDGLKTSPMLFIPGNHDYYGLDLLRARDTFKLYEDAVNELARQKGYRYEVKMLLDGDWAHPDFDVSFIGSTLWSDLSRVGPLEKFNMTRLFNDFSKIQNMTLEAWQKAHREAWDTLQALSRSADACGEVSVFVTHFAPVLACMSDDWRREFPYPAGFANNFDEWLHISGSYPDYWLHGHIHESVNLTVGKTTILSNPRGAGRYMNPEFNPDIVLEIE